MDNVRLLSRFMGAHMLKESKVDFDIIYDGSVSNLGNTLDASVAEERFTYTEKKIEYKKFSIKFLGDVINVGIPVFSKKAIKESKSKVSVKIEYLKLLNTYIKQGVLSDRRGTIIAKLMDNMDVIELDGDIGFLQIVEFKNNEIVFKSRTKSFEAGTEIFDIDVEKQGDIDRYENIMLLLKEVKDGYYDVRTHNIADKIGKTMTQKDYKIGKDVIIELEGESIKSVKQIDTEYTSIKEKKGWFILTPEYQRLQREIDRAVEDITSLNTLLNNLDGKPVNPDKIRGDIKVLRTKIGGFKYKQRKEKILASKFKAWDIKVDGKLTTITLVGAYTHLLRDMLDFKPLAWQYNFLMGQKRLSFVAGSRRSGKTLLSSYIIIRELWRMPNSIKHIQRTVKSFYIAPSEDKFKEVIDYIKTASESIRLLRVLDFNKKENRLYLYDERVSRNQKVSIVVSTCDFVSGKGFEPGRGKASDLVIIDEAAFVHEDVYLNILPIINNERAKFYAISTIERGSMRNWFYEALVDAEMGYDVEAFGMRVTIDDIEEILISDEDKKRMKRALRHLPARYYAELYATFPNAENVFNSEGFFNISREKHNTETISTIIIGYDPAKRSDTGAVVVGEVRVSTKGSYIELVEEYGLHGEYTQQKEFIQTLKQDFIYKGFNVVLIMDVTGVGEAVSEIFGNIVDYKVLYTAKGARPTIDNYGARKVPKTNLVHGTQIIIEKNMMKAYSGLVKLMDEMKYFTSFTTQAGNTKYEAASGHDDYVNSMLLIGFWYNYIEGNIYNFSSGMEIRQDGVGSNGLFEPYSERSDGQVKLKGNAYGFGC